MLKPTLPGIFSEFDYVNLFMIYVVIFGFFVKNHTLAIDKKLVDNYFI